MRPTSASPSFRTRKVQSACGFKAQPGLSRPNNKHVQCRPWHARAVRPSHQRMGTSVSQPSMRTVNFRSPPGFWTFPPFSDFPSPPASEPGPPEASALPFSAFGLLRLLTFRRIRQAAALRPELKLFHFRRQGGDSKARRGWLLRRGLRFWGQPGDCEAIFKGADFGRGARTAPTPS